LTAQEIAELKKSRKKIPEKIIWVRNLDQWREDIRTSLNGLLEDGYIDIEVDEGKFERFYKPDHVKFAPEIGSDTLEEFSSASYNRYSKIGVSNERPETVQGSRQKELSDFERVLTGEYDLDRQEAEILNGIYSALNEIDQNRRWARRENYQLTAQIVYCVAEAISLAKQEDGRWQDLLESMAKSGYDPRSNYSQGPPSERNLRKIYDNYQKILSEIMVQELMLVLGARFKTDNYLTDISDNERFKEVIKTVFKVVMKIEEIPMIDNVLRFGEKGIIERIGKIPLNPLPGQCRLSW